MSRIFYLSQPDEISCKLRALLPSAAEAEWHHFPSGEWHLIVHNAAEHCWVVGNVCPGGDSLWQTLLLIDTLNQYGAKTVSLLIPYLSYARQDRATLAGECISAATQLKLLTSVGADNIITIDLHSTRNIQHCAVPLHNLDPSPFFAAALQPQLSGIATVLSPDKGGIERAEALRRQLGITNELVWIEKRRYQNRVTSEALHGELHGDVIIVVDDIIDTGSTLLQAVEMSPEAARYWICATHALCSDDKVNALLQNPKIRLIISNTLPLPSRLAQATNVTRIDLSPLLATAIIKGAHGPQLNRPA